MAVDKDLVATSTYSAPWVFGAGAAVGVLGGMIGLGGAEFRLPLLIGLFGFAALSAVILNKAMSLVVVLAALPARFAAVPVRRWAGCCSGWSRIFCWFPPWPWSFSSPPSRSPGTTDHRAARPAVSAAVRQGRGPRR
ncbi:hypothetical protein ACWGN5_36585 [Streptomyces sp. NPDC055815]